MLLGVMYALFCVTYVNIVNLRLERLRDLLDCSRLSRPRLESSGEADLG